MTTLLTDNLPLLAGAPSGIKKLRELILELAVRGKLVPQDPSDEPASELLRRIAEEKARLVAEGKIKKQKALSERDAEDPAFELPAGWAWARLADVVNVLNGRAYKKEELLEAGTPVLRVGNLFTSNHWYYSTLTLAEDKYCNPGDLLFAWSASFGPFIWHGERSIYHYHIWKLDFYAKGQLSKHYLYNWLLEKTQEIKAAGHGVSMVHMTKEKMEKLVVPVPPLAEQDRIVAKVDELMALCDRLEDQQTDAEIAHAQLVQALLDSLTQASDANDFTINWQRLAEHFHTMFTTEPSIDALKQSLLQLAVTGKLVPQDVSVCLQDGLPAGWDEIRIEEFCTVQGGIQKTPLRRPISQHFPYLRVANVQRGRIDVKELERYELSLAELAKWRLNAGDLLIVEGNGSENEIGRCAIWRGEVEDCVYQNHLMRVRPEICEQVEYLALYLNSPVGIAHMKRLAITTSGLFNLSVGKIRSIPVALPPVSEQRRIVAKVDQLMELCDQLKTYLTQGRLLNEQLANTLIQHALAEDDQRVLRTMDRQAARTLLAAEITHRLHNQRTFGQRKLQKVIYLAEHAARLAEIRGDYLRDAAGPHDRQLMNKVEGEMQDHQWYERIERETVGHAYRPLSHAGHHRQAYCSAWPVAERATIEQVIELMRDWDTDRCEMTVTLYAAWNDFILESRPVSDEAIVDEVMHSWNDTKLRFGKTEWLAVLAEMKKHKILMPNGFGKRTTGGMLSLPGFE
ncbi:restriction endonuclease [Pseudomonas aylmerensis]|uniref:Restriction endonuclease n=1 Tax=Pseudomonas aylmerensis TaxID=1869229 RepID=A0A2T4FV83_9PSED|nr:restriction endonuclease subunit S [Pseudomonas aylmerensis]PTC27280.1 restriction endonuclease [Pseudomonas aylmerensis]